MTGKAKLLLHLELAYYLGQRESIDTSTNGPLVKQEEVKR